MRTRSLLTSALCLALVAGVATLIADAPKPKHINRAIELLADGQPVYYTGSHSGTEGSYEQGVKDAQTYAELRASSQQKCHVRSYLEAHQPHLLRAYDADFLVQAIETKRTKFSRSMAS